jgi:hypothetical protein
MDSFDSCQICPRPLSYLNSLGPTALNAVELFRTSNTGIQKHAHDREYLARAAGFSHCNNGSELARSSATAAKAQHRRHHG